MKSDKKQTIQFLLQDMFERKKAVNPRYSLRAYSRFIGINDSTLSKIMKGERPLKRDLRADIAEKLQVPVNDILWNDDRELIPFWSQIPHDNSSLVQCWLPFTILELIRTSSFQSDSAWIAKRLGADEAEVKEVLEKLFSAGWLKDENGKWVDCLGAASSFSTPTSEALREHQKRLLTKSLQRLEDTPISKRSHSSVILSANKKDIDKVKKKIESLRKTISQISRRADVVGEEVYALQVSYFPLSQSSEHGESL